MSAQAELVSVSTLCESSSWQVLAASTITAMAVVGSEAAKSTAIGSQVFTKIYPWVYEGSDRLKFDD